MKSKTKNIFLETKNIFLVRFFFRKILKLSKILFQNVSCIKSILTII